MVDRISELPDDILVSIISLLPFREAKAAKLLSARWRRLNPTGKVVSFKFPAATHRREGYEYVQVADEAKFFDYINWVNRGGLDSYKAAASAGGGAVKLLRIDIPSFDDEAETKLVEFATSMEAEIIDIRTIYSPGIPLTYPYVRNITAGVLIDSPLKCLKELSLSGVALHSHDMGALLWKAVGLERLAIESPRLIPAGEFCMHVDGDPACRLKHLQISNVLRNELTICVQGLMRLVSLKFDGLGAFTLDLQNLPELVHLRARTAAPSAVVGISCLDCARLLRRLELSVGLFNCGLKVCVRFL
ncbi:hypothetical protein C2S52_000306 [Perilla frutescens var. hirtella]|nr:hypothetical protein C2S51_008088 [Perilla frutescens var. frutescens]KAH6799842.1 hypothetical protein C2S52_000306 [Perilla frutescens var. hirtella]